MRGVGQITALMVGQTVGLTRSWITPEEPRAPVFPQPSLPLHMHFHIFFDDVSIITTELFSLNLLGGLAASFRPRLHDPTGPSDEFMASQLWRKKTQTEAGSGRNVI